MKKKPICKECELDQKRYAVRVLGHTSTLIGIPNPYWDENGEYVVPKNPNSIKTSYQCSNGHSWKE